MIISTEQTKNGRIRVFGDGELLFTVTGEFWYAQNIYDGDDVPAAQMEELARTAEVNRCLNAAYTYLARRPHTVWELRGKLRQKFDEAAVSAAIAQAAEMGLLDDLAFAAEYAEELLRLKHYAPMRIKAELMKRGVGRAEAQQALDTLDFSAEEELRLLLAKKYHNDLSDEKGKRHAISALMRYGYSLGDIQKAIDEWTSDEVFTDE